MSQFPMGLPGIGSSLTLTPRKTFSVDTMPGDFVGSTRMIDGANARDPGNDRADMIRPGLLLGVITATSAWGASIIGVTSGALTSTGTSITIPAASAVELVRRCGATGTLTLTGPNTTVGTVRSLTATYSAVDTSTGAITITALGVNEVQKVAPNALMTGGNLSITASDKDGKDQTVVVAYTTDWATTVAAVQTALVAALGTTAVTCAVADTSAFTITFSGANYAATAQPLVRVSILEGETGSAVQMATATVTRTTAGVDGRFIAGSFVGPVDGSQTPVTFFTGNGVVYPAQVTDVNLASISIGNCTIPVCSKPVYTTNLVNYPTNAKLIAWVKSSLRSAVPGMTFSDEF